MADLKNLHTLQVAKTQDFPELLLRMPNLSKLKIGVDYRTLIMLPKSWGDLRNLQNLSCSSVLNLLSIGSLSRLQVLDIHDSKETIPTGAIQSKFIKSLHISSIFYKKHTLPKIQSVRLESLTFRGYKLQYLPNILVRFTRLRELHIPDSNLKHFPEELSRTLRKLEVLDIGKNSLMTLPDVWCCRRLRELNLQQAPNDSFTPVIEQLTCLTFLNVSECRLFTFPSALMHLAKLRELDISNNYITDLPSEWNNHCLEFLNMADNSLGRGSSLDPIAKLCSLEILDLSGNDLNKFPTTIQCLKFLSSLNVSNNPIKEFPVFMGNIQTLKIFKCSACELHEIPRFLLQLQKIKTIELDKNKIKRIPEGWNLPTLETLKMSNNMGLQIPSGALLGIGSLSRLELASCGLTEIPEVINRVPVLNFLDLEDNIITRIPEERYRAVKEIHHVKINTNVLTMPPKEIYEGSEESVNQYYRDLKISEACNVGFHNVILLGSTTSGKTSLIQSLINGTSTLTKLDDRTVAVDEEIWELIENLHFHVIDLGGHDLYELTYPIFLKDRKASIIIAVDLSKLSDKTIEEILFKWLCTVLNICADSTDIIVAGTKADLCENESRKISFLRRAKEEWIWQMINRADSLFNSEELSKERKDQIQNFQKMATQEIITLTTSSLSMSGLKELKQILLKNGREKAAYLPSSWHQLYETISNLKHEISSEGFYRVALLSRLSKEPMTTGTIQTCLTYMHQRGMVFWYGNDRSLKNYVFYDIKFIVAILKQILTHEIESDFKVKVHKPFFKTLKRAKDICQHLQRNRNCVRELAQMSLAKYCRH